jgi:uncharacterized protein (DUF1800 family)
MTDLRTAIALHRFGLGARPGGLDRLGADPREALLGDVTARHEPSPFAGLLTSQQLLERFMDFRGERQAARAAASAGQAATPVAGTANAPQSVPPPSPSPAPTAAPAPAPASGAPATQGVAPVMSMQNPVPAFVQDEVWARLQAGAKSPLGFQERLVLFWADHFTVASVNPRVRITCGAFEREAIRPNIAGRFEDLALAVMAHPAMLIYLDNAQSIGPGSIAGINRRRGLNENLAREILELHTLGVDGGYTQSDVTRLAEILTGWSLVGPNGEGGKPGEFLFRPRAHEPGSRAVLGRTYAQEGIEQGRAVLMDLARHPATARHVATKLVRHFIADEPPQPAIERVAQAFTRSGGRLPAVYEALLSAPEAWEPRQKKLRKPYEYVVATLRALSIEPETAAAMRALVLMGQPMFGAPSPKGWPEEAAAWTAPDAFKTRLDMAEIAARRAGDAKPMELAKSVLGPLLADETEAAIRRAESRHQAVALLLMSPEFQRR